MPFIVAKRAGWLRLRRALAFDLGLWSVEKIANALSAPRRLGQSRAATFFVHTHVLALRGLRK